MPFRLLTRCFARTQRRTTTLQAVKMNPSFLLLGSGSSRACRVTVLLFLENKLKGLSYVALPRLFPVSYYFRPGSDGVGAGYPERWRQGRRRGRGQKSISPSRKTEKAFRLSRPRSLCLCLLDFPIYSFFFSSSVFSSSTFLVAQRDCLAGGYTFPLMC